ncbi:MAG: TetR/AcrR family transcriptional regulator [Anaerolineae bacterium]
MTKPSGRRAQQKEETRSLIVDTARKLFADQGFDKTTIRAIAEEADIAVGTIFVHFPDKSALLAATLYEDVEQALRTAFATLPDNAPVKDKLLHLAQTLYSQYAQNPPLTRVLLQEILFMGGEWGDAFQSQSLTFISQVAALLAAAQAAGELPPDANCQLIATAFFSQYFMVLINGLRGDTFDPQEQMLMLSQLIGLIF